MNLMIIGTGLIGGSFALALQEGRSNIRVTGVDKDKEHLQQALDQGIIHRSGTLEDVKEMDLVILAVPVNVAPTLLKQVLDRTTENTLVMDMGSTKEKLCRSVANHPRRKNFLAAHPIAGTEFSGPSAAFAQLYRNKKMVLCEVEKTDENLLQDALDLFEELGLEIRHMHPEEHDRHLAYVSHLSHISSFMLGNTVLEKEQDERNILDLAGSGFESTVRLAKSSPDMWVPILEQNREPVLEALDLYIMHLQDFRKSLEQEQYQDLYQDMKRANVLKPLLGKEPIEIKTTKNLQP